MNEYERMAPRVCSTLRGLREFSSGGFGREGLWAHERRVVGIRVTGGEQLMRGAGVQLQECARMAQRVRSKGGVREFSFEDAGVWLRRGVSQAGAVVRGMGAWLRGCAAAQGGCGSSAQGGSGVKE